MNLARNTNSNNSIIGLTIRCSSLTLISIPLLFSLFAGCVAGVSARPASETDYSDITTGTDPVSRRVVRLNVPLVRQPRAKLCGPAVMEMVFRFWGETDYDQFEIARAMVLLFRNESGRFQDSQILVEIQRNARNGDVDWRKYPGTGTYQMREFLSRFAPTVNPRIKNLPETRVEAAKIRDRFFQELQGHLDSGSPVIVHQWYNESKNSQHYRLVTGYDDVRRIVFLNDPADGFIEMSYDRFLGLWNVEENWLPYNNIVFNRYAPGRVEKGSLDVNLILSVDN